MTAASPTTSDGLRLGRFFAQLSPGARHLLCTSDVEPYRLRELLALADEESSELWAGLELGYTHPGGLPALREEIAGLYAGVEAGDVLTFAGADEAIFLGLHALLGPGDHAVVTWPGYQSLRDVARATGADVDVVPLEPDAGWELDLGRLRRSIRRHTRALIVNFPHNPTGALPARETFDALVELAAEAGAVLFSDEVYRLLEHDPAVRLPAAVEYGGRAASLGVLSKSFGLAGLRIGWIATRDRELLRRVATCKEYLSSGSSAPSEVLALVALRARVAVHERSLALIDSNLALLDRFFAERADVLSWVRPRAGCVGFPQLDPAFPVEPLAARLVEQEGVLIVPGSVFGDDGNRFRLGFGRADLPRALAGFERFLRRELRRAAA